MTSLDPYDFDTYVIITEGISRMDRNMNLSGKGKLSRSRNKSIKDKPIASLYGPIDSIRNNENENALKEPILNKPLSDFSEDESFVNKDPKFETDVHMVSSTKNIHVLENKTTMTRSASTQKDTVLENMEKGEAGQCLANINSLAKVNEQQSLSDALLVRLLTRISPNESSLSQSERAFDLLFHTQVDEFLKIIFENAENEIFWSELTEESLTSGLSLCTNEDLINLLRERMRESLSNKLRFWQDRYEQYRDGHLLDSGIQRSPIKIDPNQRSCRVDSQVDRISRKLKYVAEVISNDTVGKGGMVDKEQVKTAAVSETVSLPSISSQTPITRKRHLNSATSVESVADSETNSLPSISSQTQIARKRHSNSAASKGRLPGKKSIGKSCFEAPSSWNACSPASGSVNEEYLSQRNQSIDGIRCFVTFSGRLSRCPPPK